MYLNMKNRVILSLSMLMLFAVSACVKTDTKKYTGVYVGTLTSADIVKKNIQLTFTNASNKKTLSLFDIDLTKISENQFEADAEIVLEIIHLIDTNVTVDMLSNTSATFVFENNEVSMDMKYNFSRKMTDVINVRYIGKK